MTIDPESEGVHEKKVRVWKGVMGENSQEGLANDAQC